MKNGELSFLEALFSTLNATNVRYAVLRNAETLPQSLNGGDVDIITTAEDLIALTGLLRQVAEVCGGGVMAQMCAPHFVQMELLGCVKGSWWGCCVDIFDGVYVQSALCLVDSAVLSHRVKTLTGVWTLDRVVGQYLGYAKELLVNGKRATRYERDAQAAMASRKDSIVRDKRMRAVIAEALKGNVARPGLCVGRQLLVAAFCSPILFLRSYGGFVFSRFVRYFKPCGKLIAVMGSDGAGKTTILEAILPVIRAMNHNGTVVHHLKPDLLPPLGRFRGVKPEAGRICATPHASRPSGFVFSVVRVFYLLMDYILGYWLKVRVRIAKTPIAYWIFDRYAYDLLIDPRRFRVKLPQGLIKAFLFFVPRPDLIICLGGDPEKIYARKPETNLDEVRRQVAALKKFADGNRRSVWIDTTGTVEECANATLNVILKNLRKDVAER